MSKTPPWLTEAVFYQIFPDRFSRSGRVPAPGPLEPWDAPPTFHGFKGGDLYGIAERLDELAQIGANAIYLTPIFASPASHRYHTTDYFAVDPLLGGNDALRVLLERAHARGLRVVLDGVFNHVGRGFYPFVHVLENGLDSPYLDWFHVNRAWLRSGKPLRAFVEEEEIRRNRGRPGEESYGYACWWNLPALPKLNTSNPHVRDFLFAVARHWMEFGADGWRLDVPNEIDDDQFWRDFRTVVKKANPEAYIVGEIWEDARRWLKGDQFDGVMNYLLGRNIVSYCAAQKFRKENVERSGYESIKLIDTPTFVRNVRATVRLYPWDHTLAQLNVLGSHDTPRLLTLFEGDLDAMRMAYALLFVMPGAPCIYYGDEVGMLGKHDPDCRGGFPPKPVAHPLRDWLARLALLRRTHAALRDGSFDDAEVAAPVAAFARTGAGERCLVLANAGISPVPVTVQVPRWAGTGALGFRCALGDGQPLTLTDGRATEVVVPPRQVLLYSQGSG